MCPRSYSRLGVILLVVSLAQIHGSDALGSLNAKQQVILDNIFKDYDNRIRPIGTNVSATEISTSDPPAMVFVNMYVLTISEVNDMKMDYTLQMYLRQEWNDPRLKYTNDKGATPVLTLTDITKIWKPDIMFTNEKKGFQHQLVVPNQFARIYPNGNVLYSSRLTLTADCPMNLQFFPFDSQTCDLMLESYGSTTKEMKLQWKEENPVMVSEAIFLPRFNLESFDTKNLQVSMTTGEYSILNLSLTLRRRIGSYLLRIYIPCAMLVIVSWVCFWIDGAAITARSVIGISTLLTLAMLTSAFNTSLVAVSYTKAVDVWTGICLTFVFVALMETMTVHYLSRTVKKQQVVDESMQDAEQQGASLIQMETTDSKKDNTLSLKGRVNQCRTRLAKMSTGSTKLDVVSRVAFPLAFVVFFLVYTIVYTIYT